MTDETIALLQRIGTIIAGEIRPVQKKAQAFDVKSTLVCDLGLDEVSLACIAMEIEDQLSIEIDDATLHGWSTVADVIDSARMAVAA